MRGVMILWRKLRGRCAGGCSDCDLSGFAEAPWNFLKVGPPLGGPWPPSGGHAEPRCFRVNAFIMQRLLTEWSFQLNKCFSGFVAHCMFLSFWEAFGKLLGASESFWDASGSFWGLLGGFSKLLGSFWSF